MFFIIPRRASKALLDMTNQQMNRCLKDLCEICGFNTPYTITYYRTTSVTTKSNPSTNSLAPTPDVVMKFTGHCDYKSMKPYIDITESAKNDAIKKMEEAFKKK